MDTIINNWPVWFVTLALVVAAWIDGKELRVPNWLTFSFIATGWIYSGFAFGLEGLGWSLTGTVVGLALLLPAYAIGGMGAGDVKLLAGIGAWMYSTHTFYAFIWTTVIGAVMAIMMVLYNKSMKKHSLQFMSIFNEIMTIRDPNQLSAIAADRKPTMMLLPYGIPMAFGTIAYFAWSGLLV